MGFRVVFLSIDADVNKKIDMILVLTYMFLSFLVGLFLLWFYNGLSPDSMVYVLGATSLTESGNYAINVAFLENTANLLPVIRFPPFFPFIISLLAMLGFDPNLAGRLIAILSYSLTIIPLFLLARRISSSRYRKPWKSAIIAFIETSYNAVKLIHQYN